MKEKKQIKAFTLSEVLITLGIIGVVAGITIPILINKSTDKQHSVAYQKVFSTISNSTNLIKNEHGGVLDQEYWTTLSGGGCPNDFNMYNDYKSQLKTLKLCEADISCMPASYKTLGGDPYEIPGIYTPNLSGIVLTSGEIMYFLPGPNNIINDEETCNKTPSECVNVIAFDINGTKKPNILGKDLFMMYILGSGKVVPAGYDQSEATINSDCPDSKNSGTGLYCGEKIILGKY